MTAEFPGSGKTMLLHTGQESRIESGFGSVSADGSVCMRGMARATCTGRNENFPRDVRGHGEWGVRPGSPQPTVEHA
jgi:hypothetical protein